MTGKMLAAVPWLGLCLIAASVAWALYWYVLPRSWRRAALLVASAALLLGVFGPLFLSIYGLVLVATYVAARPGDRKRLPWVVASLLIVDLLAFAASWWFEWEWFSGYLFRWEGSPFAAFRGRLNWGVVAHIMGAYSLVRLITYAREISTGESPRRGFLDFALYVVFFPTFLMGPITRYGTFWEQARANEPRPARQQMLRGLWKLGRSLLMSVPLALVLIAMNRIQPDQAFLRRDPAFVTWKAWVHILLCTLHWFTSFSVYTDFAIGLGRLLGYELPENFRGAAFLQRSMTDFWRNFHMTMSSWLRDHIYIPLGGNRRHQTLNITATFVLCGIWHAPMAHFVLWGFLQAMGIDVHHRFREWRKRRYGDVPASTAWHIASYGLTYVYFAFTWPSFTYGLMDGLRYYALLLGISLAP